MSTDFLTPEQISEYKEAFKMFCGEGGDKVTKDSLKSVLRQMGMKPTDAEVAQMIKDGDTSGRGTISFDEFVSMMTEQLRKMDSPDEIIRAFESYDPYGKGVISREDFNSLITSGGYAKFKPAEIEGFIRQGKSDKGDAIDYYALVKQVTGAPTS
jgi:calmodulin